MNLIPTRYRLPWTHYYNSDAAHSWASIEATKFDEKGQPTKWCILEGGSCLAIDGEFEYEPQPSSRSEAFFERTRFNTVEEAYAMAEKWMGKSNRAPSGDSASREK